MSRSGLIEAGLVYASHCIGGRLDPEDWGSRSARIAVLSFLDYVCHHDDTLCIDELASEVQDLQR